MLPEIDSQQAIVARVSPRIAFAKSNFLSAPPELISPNENARDPAGVNRMFGAIARRYDLANRVLSCGIDVYWRKRAARIVASWQPKQIADLATGTGDLVLALQKKLPAAEITGVDFTEPMLQVARAKGLTRTVVADILALPFADESFDCVTIAFGLRNVTNWGAGLREMARVVRPGGHLLVLDFSLPRSILLRGIYRFYLHRFLPLVAELLTKTKSAYEYLGGSIEEFPSGEAMVQLMEANGFGEAQARSLTAGIVTIYTATKPVSRPPRS